MFSFAGLIVAALLLAAAVYVVWTLRKALKGDPSGACSCGCENCSGRDADKNDCACDGKPKTEK